MDCEQLEFNLFGDAELQYLLADFSEKQHQVYITTLPKELQSILTNNKLANLGEQIDKIKLTNTKQIQVLTTNQNNKYAANFVIDIAAEAYVIADKRLFHTLKECKIAVSWGSAKTMQITGYGTVYI